MSCNYPGYGAYPYYYGYGYGQGYPYGYPYGNGYYPYQHGHDDGRDHHDQAGCCGGDTPAPDKCCGTEHHAAPQDPYAAYYQYYPYARPAAPACPAPQPKPACPVANPCGQPNHAVYGGLTFSSDGKMASLASGTPFQYTPFDRGLPTDGVTAVPVDDPSSPGTAAYLQVHYDGLYKINYCVKLKKDANTDSGAVTTFVTLNNDAPTDATEAVPGSVKESVMTNPGIWQENCDSTVIELKAGDKLYFWVVENGADDLYYINGKFCVERINKAPGCPTCC